MDDESMGKRANGSGGRGHGGGGGSSGRPPARRDGPRETVKLVEQLRDHFSAFADAAYFTRGAGGVRGAAARRELAERLELSAGLIPDVIALLNAEAVDMEKASQSVADDLSKKTNEKP